MSEPAEVRWSPPNAPLTERIAAVPTRMADRLRYDPGLAVVTIATISWLFVMGLNVWRRHDRFDTFDNDLGFHTQYVWLLARGHWFSSILGLRAFGHNATFGYLLYAPFSWFGAGAQFLDLTQTLAIGLGVVPVYRLARRRLGASWVVAAMPLAYLLHPVTQGNVWETWHPEAMAMTPLLFAYAAADEKRWRWYWLFVGLAIIWKTDVALFIAMLGLVLWARGEKKVGKRTVLLGSVWFALVLGVMIPTLSGGGTVFGPLYGDLGNNPVQVVQNSVNHPTRLWRHLEQAEPVRYSRDLLAPYGFVPVLAPVTLLVGLPQNAVSLLSDAAFTRDPIDNPHYQALPLVALTLALIEAVTWIKRRRPALLEPAIVIVLAAGLASSTAWGSLPFGVRFSHFWSEDGDPLRAAKEAAIALPGPDDVVSAQYRLVPHLAERYRIYSFPNPWRLQYFGVEGTTRPDPARVEWLILDETVLGSEDDIALVECITSAGTFTEELRNQQIVVYHRIPTLDPVDRACP